VTAAKPSGEFAASDFVDGWRMLQDETWPANVAETMTSVARGAAEYDAGSAASSGYGLDDRWLFTFSVCFVGDDVVGHFVDIARQEQSWGLRSRASLTASQGGSDAAT
jgi:hypothetical protein